MEFWRIVRVRVYRGLIREIPQIPPFRLDNFDEVDNFTEQAEQS